MHKLILPLVQPGQLAGLRVGDRVTLSGTLYTARDAAHARLRQGIAQNQPPPCNFQNSGIYYCGPCPAPPGFAIGSCGPTTADRMDAATPDVLFLGVRVLVGKGPRGALVRQALAAHGAVYLATWGGAGALLAEHVKDCRLIAYPELGPEAIYALTIEDFPAIVAIDAQGADLYARHGQANSPAKNAGSFAREASSCPNAGFSAGEAPSRSKRQKHCPVNPPCAKTQGTHTNRLNKSEAL